MSFSPRRFLLLVLLLAVGVGMGIGLERYFRPSPAIAPAAVAAPASPPQTAPAPSPAAALSVDAWASFTNNLYPSLMLSFGSTHPGFTRCITVEIRNAALGKPCRVRIESALFQQPLVATVIPAAEDFEVSPDLPWNYDALRRRTQLLPESFVVSVADGAGAESEKTVAVSVHPVNEVVSRLFNHDTGEWQNMSICYAAFVNEDHPWIGTLLQEALALGEVRRFTGYQADPQGVEAQVRAIWDALAARGLSYVDLATTSGGVPDVATQYVRFLDQSVRDKGANCVDASVLLASIFRRIGLRPVLLFKPGHCFVAVYESAQGGRLIALETTMIGGAPFAAAEAYGARELAATLPYIDSADYSSVDIALARQQGIRPIEYVDGGESR